MILLAALALAAQQPADFAHEEESDLLAFSYGWPAAAEREPALRARLTARMAAARREALANARETRRVAGRNFTTQEYSEMWEARGSGGSLLSLAASIGTSGGAHPTHSVAALLWDLAAHREVPLRAVLGPGLAGMSERYCTALDAERAEQRGEPVVRDPQDPFTLCPPIAEQVDVPIDSDGNGRFDTLRILLPPYIAGPYTEGDYEVDVPFEAQDLAAIAPGYRADFEVPGDRIRPLPAQ